LGSGSAQPAELLRAFKMLFDPACRFNPGKLLPTGRGCAEIRVRA
jgi:FAD/FMN-containing dehydrogenase